jgi:colanic acid biosynthesis protein WcaH
MIPEGLYRQIISLLPVLCIDIVLRNSNGKYLLARRDNEPLRGEWWVIGGRINHGETALKTCARKLFEEINLKANNFRFIGFYEDNFHENAFEKKSYHTVSLVFEALLDEDGEKAIKLDSQHSEWGWFDKLPDRFHLTSM